MIVPAFLDGFTQLIGFRVSNNILRLSHRFNGGCWAGYFNQSY